MDGILECKNKRQLSLFEQVPEILHHKDPFFIPPFPGSISKLFGPKSPFLRHGELKAFIAYKDGKPVGRIAASVNRAHNSFYKDKTGFFGFFDCIDDIEVAKSLLERARTELKNYGLETLRGPYNLTVNDEVGLLVDGFETSPFIMMPYNPPYYLKLYEALGLIPARNLFAYYMSASEMVPEKVRRVVERVKKRSGITVRNLSLKNLNEELKIIQELYNETLKGNWGFIPITYEDLEFAAGDLKQIVDPELVMIAEKDGRAVGFSMTLPNINEFMWKAKSSKGLMRILKFVWLAKTRHPKEARLAVMGVRPEFQASGLAAVFYYETLVRGGKKFIGGELSWVDESNESMVRSIDVMGAKKYKTYCVYEMPIVSRI